MQKESENPPANFSTAAKKVKGVAGKRQLQICQRNGQKKSNVKKINWPCDEFCFWTWASIFHAFTTTTGWLVMYILWRIRLRWIIIQKIYVFATRSTECKLIGWWVCTTINCVGTTLRKFLEKYIYFKHCNNLGQIGG